MSLTELLATLKENEMLYVEITETEDNKEVVLIGFEASGWESLSTELLARTVDKVTVDTSSVLANIKIHLSDN